MHGHLYDNAQITEKRRVTLNEFQKLAGKLQHASMGIPGGTYPVHTHRYCHIQQPIFYINNDNITPMPQGLTMPDTMHVKNSNIRPTTGSLRTNVY